MSLLPSKSAETGEAESRLGMPPSVRRPSVHNHCRLPDYPCPATLATDMSRCEVSPFPLKAGPPVGDLGHRWRWSVWRRRHQARARTCHYRRQTAWQP